MIKVVIVDELHKTYPFITKYEYARVIGMRAKQLNNGADPFVKVDRGMIDGYTIALKEMEEKKNSIYNSTTITKWRKRILETTGP